MTVYTAACVCVYPCFVACRAVAGRELRLPPLAPPGPVFRRLAPFCMLPATGREPPLPRRQLKRSCRSSATAMLRCPLLVSGLRPTSYTHQVVRAATAMRGALLALQRRSALAERCATVVVSKWLEDRSSELENKYKNIIIYSYYKCPYYIYNEENYSNDR